MLMLVSWCPGSACDPCKPPPPGQPPGGGPVWYHWAEVAINEYQIVSYIDGVTGLAEQSIELIGSATIWSGLDSGLPANTIAFVAPGPVGNYGAGTISNVVVYKSKIVNARPLPPTDPLTGQPAFPVLPDVTSGPLTFGAPYTSLDTNAVTTATKAAITQASNLPQW